MTRIFGLRMAGIAPLAALAALGFCPAADAQWVGTAPIQWTQAQGGNDHWYQLVYPTSNLPAISQSDARAMAGGMSFLGLQGYLPTITSAGENAFIETIFAGSGTSGGWMDGNDAQAPGEWRWSNGPEAGTLFWTGGHAGQAIGYANFSGGRPNDGAGADFLVFGGHFSAGHWFLAGPSVGGEPNRFYVEYSAPVPEPATALLCGLGLLTLVARVARQRRQR